ncbi:hypothetical protein Q1695_014188 [Nippostrongylus brasiliensis]|nr:hypothetical protein Q1695_014188 [Nippostrongylus brasiliensis]
MVTPEVETKLRAFMEYWNDNWGVGGRFFGLCDHSNNNGARTTNMVGFHNKLRSFCPNSAPSMTQLLQFLACEISLAKALIKPLQEDEAAPRLIRSDERERQAGILNEMRRFQLFLRTIGRLPTTRECKGYLETLAALFAH